VVVFGILGAHFTPCGGAEGVSRALMGDPSSRSERRMASNSAIEVPISHEGGGLWIDVQINDRTKTRMLLDTGASAVVLPARMARALGIEDEGRSQQLRTLKGMTTGRLVTLKRVKVGRYSVAEVSAVVMDEDDDLPSALLGRSFLNNFSFGVDLDRSVLTLLPRRLAASSLGTRDVFPPSTVWSRPTMQLSIVRRPAVEPATAWRRPSPSPRQLVISGAE